MVRSAPHRTAPPAPGRAPPLCFTLPSPPFLFLRSRPLPFYPRGGGRGNSHFSFFFLFYFLLNPKIKAPAFPERPLPGSSGAGGRAAGGQSRAERSGHLRSAPPEQPPRNAAGVAPRSGAEGHCGAGGPHGREQRTRLVGRCPAACTEGVLGEKKNRGAFRRFEILECWLFLGEFRGVFRLGSFWEVY